MMSALHWICALTLALVCCLSAQPVKRETNDLLQMVSHFNETIIKRNFCENASLLYSPSNVDMEYLHSALNCAMKELNTLNDECTIPEDDSEDFTNLLTGLESETKRISSISTKEFQCEKYEKANAKQFVINIKGLVEQLYSLINS